MVTRIIALSLCFGASLATSVFAHDEGVNDKARHLGIAVGKTFACHPEVGRSAARADFEEMFDMIYHTDGNEIAFVFAVAIGYGAASDVTEAECAELMPLVDAAKAELGLGGSE
jgi:hypothetical protein